MQRFDTLKSVESCLFRQVRTLNQVYHVRNKHGQGCVKLCTKSSLNVGPATGSTPMTKLQFTECSLTSRMATQNLLLDWTWQTWLLALSSTDIHLEGTKVSGHRGCSRKRDSTEGYFARGVLQMLPSAVAPPGLSVQLLKGTNSKLTPPVKVYVCQTTCKKITWGTLQPRLVLYA